MKEFSVPMALVDFIPVILYAAACFLLWRDLYGKMKRGAYTFFSSGTVITIIAGALKAAYKLLYAAGVCDFPILSDLFMPLQAIGFLFSGLGLMMYVFAKKKNIAAAVVPPVFSGTPLFIALMILGLAGNTLALSVLSRRSKKYGALVIFIIGFVASLCMGYLSSRDFDKAIFNWIAQGVNIIGQGSMLVGTLILHRAHAFGTDTE